MEAFGHRWRDGLLLFLWDYLKNLVAFGYFDVLRRLIVFPGWKIVPCRINGDWLIAIHKVLGSHLYQRRCPCELTSFVLFEVRLCNWFMRSMNAAIYPLVITTFHWHRIPWLVLTALPGRITTTPRYLRAT
jgi:hypothetical protein